ncbi:MAG: hypothetical protein V3U35_02270, partial [Candidatus Neomarinimicrobiota bacterium]
MRYPLPLAFTLLVPALATSQTVTKLLAPDYYFGDQFGVSVAMSGDYAIVGAHRESNDAGAAYVFRRTGPNTWDAGVKLVAPDAQDGDYFGYSAAISADYAIVGARMENTGGTGAGAAYVFRRTGLNSWDAGVKLVANLAHSDEYFGGSVAIDGDYAVVGADGDDTRGSDAGAAHVFRRTGLNSWDAGVELGAPDAEAVDNFGVSVAISGDYLVGGAHQEDIGGADAGAAYVFHRTGTNSWDGGVKLMASDSWAGDRFGQSVAIQGDYVIIGAPRGDTGGADAGAAYVFDRTGINSWDGGAKIVAPDAQDGNNFGQAVAMGGDYAIVGAWMQDDGGTDAGAAYVFKGTGLNSWDGGAKIVAPDAQDGDRFGVSVAISSNHHIVGAYLQDGGSSDAGAAYVHRLPPATPTTLAAPADGAVGQDIRPTLAWNVASGADSYRLQVASDVSFVTLVFDTDSIATTARQVGPLANNRTYHWRVRAKNESGVSDWSAAWSFTTYPPPNVQAVVIVDSFDVPGGSPTGLAWDGASLWIIDNLNNVYQLDTNGVELSWFSSPTSASDLTWDGQYLWLHNGSARNTTAVDAAGTVVKQLPMGYWSG